MSIPGGDAATIPIARPGDPVRLTSKNIAPERRHEPARPWTDGHPRGIVDPVPVARWVGPRQPLQAQTGPDSVHRPSHDDGRDGFRLEAIAALAMLREPPGTRYIALPREGSPTIAATKQARENARLLNLIDLELHAGRQIVVAIDSMAENPFADERRIGISARCYQPDGTVYYVGEDDASADGRIRLYVHEDDLSLVSLD